MASEHLRFAAFVRVSTEKQERQGESLNVQRSTIERSIKAMGGTIVEWYGGAEHATAGWERKELDRLLRDADKDRPRFDAVIVAYQDRWSRDNAKSKQSLEILRNRGIRFFVGQSESDLFNPEHILILGITAEMNQYLADQQSSKSINSRIYRARELGIPSAGKLPWGRTHSKADGWGADPDKQRLIEDVATRYLAGESLKVMAKELGVNHQNLHKTLMRRCGPEWSIRFVSKKFNIAETVPIKIPPLLPPETIAAVQEKARRNKTYNRGSAKNRYLLGKFMFCGECGYSLSGQANSNGTRHYRHHSERGCEERSSWVPADGVEEQVKRVLFEFFGNPKAMEQGIADAIPDLCPFGKRA